jgi:lipopolysaccharide transport protein LptA
VKIKNWIGVVMVATSLCISQFAWGIGKPQGPVDLEADKGTFDLKAKAHHFQGHIRLTQADFTVLADQAWVKGEPGRQVIRAQGSPVTVSWTSEHVRASALQVEYDQAKAELDLTGKVRLEQNGNSLEGEHLRYSLQTRAVIADGGKSTNQSTGRVKMRWVPAEQEGNKPATTGKAIKGE